VIPTAIKKESRIKLQRDGQPDGKQRSIGEMCFSFGKEGLVLHIRSLFLTTGVLCWNSVRLESEYKLKKRGHHALSVHWRMCSSGGSSSLHLLIECIALEQ
jgi:hypothetical protein